MGGAIVPKLMGHVGDHYGIATGFLVPLTCFGFVAAYTLFWPRLSGTKNVVAPVKVGSH